MSTSLVVIRLSGDPVAYTPKAFAEHSEMALAPAIRALRASGAPTTGPGSMAAPLLIPGGDFEPPLGVARRHGLPLSAPAALYCAPLRDSTVPAWHTGLVWPLPDGDATTVGLGHITMVCNPGRSMVEITLPLSGFPLADLTFRQDGEDWALFPSPGRAVDTGDWVRWLAALQDLDSALSGLANRVWDVETSGIVEQSDARRFIMLRDRLNKQDAPCS